MAGGIDLQVSVTGEKAVAELFRRAHPSIRGRVREAIEREAVALEQATASGPLSGGMLQVGKGRLRSGMTHKLIEAGESVGAVVFNRAQRGRARYGFMLAAGRMSGFARVSAHTRRVDAGDVHAYQLNPRTGRMRRRRTAVGIAFVRAHKRALRLPPRPFIAAAFASRRDAARAAIERAVAEGVAEAQGFAGGGGI